MFDQKTQICIIASVLFLLLVSSNSNATFADKEECKEIGNDHGDAKESEKKFYQQLETQDFCDFVEDIDREQIQGEIREDSKWDWEDFAETKVFQTAFEDAVFCMLERYDLPDGNDKQLADYEIMDCGQGNY